MRILAIIFSLIFCTLFVSASDFTVVIDAGHGGRDPGTLRGKIKEKNIVLAVSLALGKLIEDNHKDVKVVYTRKTDVFVDLHKRADIANKAKANLFISIHTNATAANQTNAQGVETFILGLARSKENLEVAKRENSVILLEEDYSTKYEGFDPKSPESNIIFEFMTNKYLDQSLQLAGYIQASTSSIAKRKNRGIRQGGLLVLSQSGMPSVLVELGFINNAIDSKFLNSTAGQQTMAKSIYAGFKKYKENFDRMQGGKATTVSNEETQKSTSPASRNQVEYRVQFLLSKKELANNSPLLKGLEPVQAYQEDNIYKYTYGSAHSLDEIVKIRNEVRKTFKDCFIVTFSNGKRIK